MSTREVIAEAVNTIGGVNCSAWFRQTTKPGDAVVQWAGMQPADNGFGYMDRWEIVLITPQDFQQHEKYISENLPDLISAVEGVLAITAINPTSLTLDTGTVLGVVIQGNRAHE